MESPITNVYNPEERRTKLEDDIIFLYHPETSDQWTYSHHPHLAFFKECYYAMWSNGQIDEDNLGQRVMISTSRDFSSWSDPVPLVGTLLGEFNELVLVACGFHQHGEKLVAYFGQYEYEPWNIENGSAKKIGVGHRYVLLSARVTTDGLNWGDPVTMDVPVVANYGPQPTATGRLIISGALTHPYTDDPTGLSDWRLAGIYPDEMNSQTGYYGFGAADHKELSTRIHERLDLPSNVRLNEGSFYQTDDGVIHMLLRSRTPFLWVSESDDDGASWSAPLKTSFTDNQAKFHFGRLPDGRFYQVGNPDPRTRGTGYPLRCPLVLSLSEDGVVFDRHYILADEAYERRFQGREKLGIYAYPHTLVHEGSLCVIFSINKEDIAVLRVDIDSI